MENAEGSDFYCEHVVLLENSLIAHKNGKLKYWGIQQHECDQNTVRTTQKNTIHFRIIWMDKTTETKYSREDIDAYQKKHQFLWGFLSVYCPSVKGIFLLGAKECEVGP